MLTSRRQLSDTVALLRWVVPVMMVLLAPGYTMLEHGVLEGTGVTSHMLREVIFLGLTGPFLAWLTLTWALDATRSREATQKELAQRNRQLAALNAVSMTVTRSLDLKSVLGSALDRVLDIMELEAGEIRTVEGDTLFVRNHRGVSDEFLEQEAMIRLGQCYCGTAVKQGDLFLVEDLADNPELRQRPCANERFRAVACVPTQSRDRIVGLLHLASRQPRNFTVQDRELLAAIGRQIGLAIENGRLYAEIKALNEELELRVTERTAELEEARVQLAHQAEQLQNLLSETIHIQENERARIAHDMHDGVIQLIVATLYELQTAKQSLADHGNGVDERLATVMNLIQQVEVEMRSVVYDLHPPILDAKGLVPALREYADRFTRVSELPCSVHVSGEPRRLAPEAETAMYRIVQEALNNIHSHAEASAAEILVRFGPRGLLLMIRDDGRGFDVAPASVGSGHHLGLMSMRERAQGIGAELEVQSAAAEGTCVVLRAPLGD
jgi:signal transduction histidine kinase